MRWLVFIYISLSFWLVETNPSLKCLIPCEYQRETSSVFYEPNKCSNKTKDAKVCSAELQFDYKKQFGKVFRDSQETLPPTFSNKIQTLTNLKTRIDLKNGYVYHNFTHYCSVNAYCTKVFLSNTFNKYRTQSYTTLIEKLRHLLRLNDTLPKPLSPISCINQDGIPTECDNGKCFVFKSPYTIYTKRGCAINREDAPAPLLINVQDMNLWIQFSIDFECYWPLCNNESLVDTVFDLIANTLNFPITTTTNIGQAIYRNTSTRVATILATETITTGTITIDEKKPSSSNHRMTSSAVIVMCLSASFTFLVYSSSISLSFYFLIIWIIYLSDKYDLKLG